MIRSKSRYYTLCILSCTLNWPFFWTIQTSFFMVYCVCVHEVLSDLILLSHPNCSINFLFFFFPIFYFFFLKFSFLHHFCGICRSGSVDLGQKNHYSSLFSRTLSASKLCRGDAIGQQIDPHALKSHHKKPPSNISNSSNVCVVFSLSLSLS